MNNQKAKTTPLLIKPFLFDEVVIGNKIVTRRDQGLKEINLQPDRYNFVGMGMTKANPDATGRYSAMFVQDLEDPVHIPCPYADRPAGDFIWFKEQTWIRRENDIEYVLYKDGTTITFKEGQLPEVTYVSHDLINYALKNGYKAQSPMFMKKLHTRVWAMVKSIHVERLQDITEKDCLAEGISKNYEDSYQVRYKNYSMAGHRSDYVTCPELSFRTLIDRINGLGYWKSNPWVWVIRFELCNANEFFKRHFKRIDMDHYCKYMQSMQLASERIVH